jgi:predicted dinucleotide-binding enzyme
MILAILGAGHVGGALATGWARAGHTVVLGVRDVAAPDVQALCATSDRITAAGVAEAALQADVIVLATPPEAVLALAPQFGDVADKVLIDATNAVRTRPEPYPHAAAALKALTNARHVVKCFNTTGYENMADPRYGGTALDMFVAGESTHGKAVATRLALDLGFAACYDFGGDDRIGLLEQLALCWINLALFQQHGRGIGFKVVRR